ncbi:hypothetical protein MRB53_026167 [Persea americana]|uniref:Uncharacterized protein n=1 Tax=Persea americana TaxID=3435 RepID=A0ACC2LHA2_PERAE|nr:hypothetical protein MRB53_026167 [Persea americana]
MGVVDFGEGRSVAVSAVRMAKARLAHKRALTPIESGEGPSGDLGGVPSGRLEGVPEVGITGEPEAG